MADETTTTEGITQDATQDGAQATATPPETPPAATPEPPADEFIDDKAEPSKYSLGDDAPKEPPAAPTPPKDPETPPAPDGQLDERFESVNKKLDQVTDRLYKQTIESDVKGILDQNPEYKPYEDRIRRFVFHENRFGLIKQGLPVSTVVLEAIAPHLEKIGAAKAKAADTKATQNKVHGENPVPKGGSGHPDYDSMTAEQITRLGEQVKSGTYKG